MRNRNLNKRLGPALARLLSVEEFQVLREEIAAALAEEDQANRVREGQKLHQGQGAAQALAGLLDLTDRKRIQEFIERSR